MLIFTKKLTIIFNISDYFRGNAKCAAVSQTRKNPQSNTEPGKSFYKKFVITRYTALESVLQKYTIGGNCGVTDAIENHVTIFSLN